MGLKRRIIDWLAKIIDKYLKLDEPIEDAKHDPVISMEETGEIPNTVSQEGPSLDGVPFEQLEWTYGGFKGNKAELATGCVISSLKVSSSGMTYKWSEGGCEKLGAADKGDHTQTLACFFVYDGRSWKGGKFDWISTSRTTRSFENIKDSYNGWPFDAVDTAKSCAFVIVSANGKRRSNVIRS